MALGSDEDTRGALRLQLKKLQEIKKAGINVAAIGDRSVAIGGSVSGSTIITGDKNKT